MLNHQRRMIYFKKLLFIVPLFIRDTDDTNLITCLREGPQKLHELALCALRLSVTRDTAQGVVRTGMGWWLPEAPGPEYGALAVNINATMSYGGPWDPITGSADTRGLPCRLTRLPEGAIPPIPEPAR